MSFTEDIILYLKDRKSKLENLHNIIKKNNNVAKNETKRNLDRAITFSQVSFVSVYSLLFLKIVLFNHYPRFNIAKKFLSLWFYQMTIDPLTLGAELNEFFTKINQFFSQKGYTGSLLYSHFEDLKVKDSN